MGEYIVNGEVIDIRESAPTAADLKRHSNSPAGDWVMANRSNGKTIQLHDQEPLPVDVIDYSIVTPFTYGRIFLT